MIRAIRAHLDRWNTYNQLVRELSSCSDRELADLHISRADITSIAREGAGL